MGRSEVVRCSTDGCTAIIHACGVEEAGAGRELALMCGWTERDGRLYCSTCTKREKPS